MKQREIKFRAWDGKAKLMSEPFSIWDLWNHDDSDLSDYKNPTLMQFTGLKDKNGKEIYEGDVVRMPATTGHGLTNAKVEYSIDFCGFELVKYDDTDSLTRLENHLYEVIGNIYENPELVNISG